MKGPRVIDRDVGLKRRELERKIPLFGLLMLTLAACGGGSPGSSHNAKVISNAQQAAVSAQAIKEAFLRLPNAHTDDVGNVEYLAPGEDPAGLSINGGCTVDVILASPEDVATYQGDPDVVLNPAGTAGVTVVGTAQAQGGLPADGGGRPQEREVRITASGSTARARSRLIDLPRLGRPSAEWGRHRDSPGSAAGWPTRE